MCSLVSGPESIVAWSSQLKTIAASFCNLSWSCKKLYVKLRQRWYHFLWPTHSTVGIIRQCNDVYIHVWVSERVFLDIILYSLERTWGPVGNLVKYVSSFGSFSLSLSFTPERDQATPNSILNNCLQKHLSKREVWSEWQLGLDLSSIAGSFRWEQPPSRQYARWTRLRRKMEDPTWFWGGVQPWKPPPRHISSKRFKTKKSVFL